MSKLESAATTICATRILFTFGIAYLANFIALKFDNFIFMRTSTIGFCIIIGIIGYIFESYCAEYIFKEKNGLPLDEDISCLPKKYLEYKSKIEEFCILEIKITECLKQRSSLQGELEQAQKHIADLEQRISNYRDIEGHGRCSTVLQMRANGKRDEEIAVYLERSGCSQPQIGVLLHRKEDANPDAMLKYAQRLLGKA